MRVIKGKQVVLQSYLTEAQCVRPVTEQDVETKVPLEYDPQQVSAQVAATGTLREHRVQEIQPEPLQAREIPIEPVATRVSQPTPIHAVASTLNAQQILAETAGENLTIEELFHPAHK